MPPLLAQIKSNNYLLNVLTHLEAADGGGTFGIIVNDDGFIAEACVLNVCSISTDGVFVTPPFEGILHGTTMRRLLDLARGPLCERGVAAGGAATAAAGGRGYWAVRAPSSSCPVATPTCFRWCEWDGVPIGDGTVGPVAKRLHDLITSETESGDGSPDDFIEVQYPVRCARG